MLTLHGMIKRLYSIENIMIDRLVLEKNSLKTILYPRQTGSAAVARGRWFKSHQPRLFGRVEQS